MERGRRERKEGMKEGREWWANETSTQGEIIFSEENSLRIV